MTERTLAEAEELMADHRERVLDVYPDPINCIALKLVQHNTRKWLTENPGTIGAENVLENGLTDNQRTWLGRLTAKAEGEHWFCAHCGAITISEGEPDACGECDEETDLQEAIVNYELSDRTPEAPLSE